MEETDREPSSAEEGEREKRRACLKPRRRSEAAGSRRGCGAPGGRESLFTRRPGFTPTEGRQEGGRVAGPRIGVRSPRGSPVREQCFL